MKLPQRKTVVKYGVTIGIGALLAWGYLASQASEYGSLWSQTTLDQLRLLCDAFMVPGLLLILSGLMVTVTNEGSLDGVTYLGHYLYHMFVPGKRASTQRYADSVETKRGKRIHGYGFLYFVGIGFLAVGAVFYVLYKFHA